MTSPSERQKVSIEKGFLQRWIFTNAVAVGIGLGLPMTVASLLSPDGHGNFLLMAVFCLGLWLGIAQWLILRKFCPLPRSWIFISAAMPWLAMVVAFGFITIHPMVGVTFMILSLPCFLGLGQWQVLRQAVRPVGRWPLITVVAIVLGTLLSMASVPLMASLISPLGLIYAICGGLGGGIYGAITGLEFSLKQWQQQKYLMPSKPTQKPTYDVPPNSSLRGWYILQTLVAVVVFSVWGWLVTYQFTIPPDRNPLFGLLSLLLILFIIQPLSVFIHELGHFLGAKLNGAELAFLGINRWIFIPSGGGFRINKSRRLIAAGFVQTVPTSLSHIDRKLFLMLLGGPMGSFCLFLATATPFFFPGWTSQNPLAWKISLLSVINLIMFITNLVPFKFGHMLTDGRRMLDLLQNNVYGQRFAALYAYETSLRKGVRPKEMQPSLVDRALALPEESSDHISGLLIAYNVALDAEQVDQAANYLDQALKIKQYTPELFRSNLLLEGTYLEAWFRNRADIARQWFDQIEETALIFPASLLRAEATLLWVEGNTQKSLVKAQEALSILNQETRVTGQTIIETEKLKKLIAKIDQGVV